MTIRATPARRGSAASETLLVVLAVGVALLIAVTLLGRKLAEVQNEATIALDGGAPAGGALDDPGLGAIGGGQGAGNRGAGGPVAQGAGGDTPRLDRGGAPAGDSVFDHAGGPDSASPKKKKRLKRLRKSPDSAVYFEVEESDGTGVKPLDYLGRNDPNPQDGGYLQGNNVPAVIGWLSPDRVPTPPANPPPRKDPEEKDPPDPGSGSWYSITKADRTYISKQDGFDPAEVEDRGRNPDDPKHRGKPRVYTWEKDGKRHFSEVPQKEWDEWNDSWDEEPDADFDEPASPPVDPQELAKYLTEDDEKLATWGEWWKAAGKGTGRGVLKGAWGMVVFAGGAIWEGTKYGYDSVNYLGRGIPGTWGNWEYVGRYQPSSFFHKTTLEGKWGETMLGMLSGLWGALCEIDDSCGEIYRDLKSNERERVEKAFEKLGGFTFEVGTIVIPGAVVARVKYLKFLNHGLVDDLVKAGVKVSKEDLIRAVRLPNKKIVFLEKGGEHAGFRHILEKHLVDFKNVGVKFKDIPNVIMKAVSEGKPIGFVGKDRIVYEIVYRGKPLRVGVTVAENGFIVGANPLGATTKIKFLSKLKK